jgi:hypothetical protein
VATYTPSPVVTASSNVAYVCVGGANTTAVLTASSSNASYSYTWQPGGMTGASVTVTPTGTTTYTVTAVDGPCSNVATVTVNGPSVPVISSTTASPSVFCGGGTSQLEYWDTGTNTFDSFTASQYSNVKLTIISNDADCEYIVTLCPRNQNTAMTIGDQTFEPYYQYYDLIDSDNTGNGLVLVPDSCFVLPACVNAPCDSTLGCMA